MALLQMQRIYIYALKDRKQILELLQRRGVVEVRKMLKEDKVFSRSDYSTVRQILEKNIAIADESLAVLNNYVKEDHSLLASLQGRKELPVEAYDSFKEKYMPTIDKAKRIIELTKYIAECRAELSKLQTQVEIIKPWVNLDIPLNFKGTKYTAGFIGTLPRPYTAEEIYERLAQYMPLDVNIISASKDQTCIFVLCLKDHKDKVYEILRKWILPFRRCPSIYRRQKSLYSLTSRWKISNSDRRLHRRDGFYDEYRSDLKFLRDYDTMGWRNTRCLKRFFNQRMYL